MNTNLKLDLDLKKILPILQKIDPYIFGVALIAVFAYTAWVVNGALNVKPAETVTAPTSAKPRANIVFDKKTIEAVKSLSVVQAEVPTGDLGKNDPFE